MSYEKTLNIIFSNELILGELKRLFDEEADKNIPILHGSKSGLSMILDTAFTYD